MSPDYVINESEWVNIIGDTKTRDGRRAGYAAAQALKGRRVSDVQVVNLLLALAVDSRRTPLQRKVLNLCNAFNVAYKLQKGCKSGDVSVSMKLQAGTPCWEILREIVGLKAGLPHGATSHEILDYQSDVQLVKLLSKYPFEGADELAEDNAIDALLEQEKRNKETNRAWKDMPENDFILRLQTEIEEILGPPPSLEEILASAAWGPGTLNDYSFGTRETGAEFKFAAMPTCSPRLTPMVSAVIQSYPRWFEYFSDQGWDTIPYRVVPADKMFTVPKKFERDRCAFLPSSINAWLQRGVGLTIRKRLAKAGIAMELQQEVNRTMAKLGSISGIYSTMDLTSASDSVCRGFLVSVLSPAWINLLKLITADYFSLPEGYLKRHPNAKRIHRFEMISAMGCGYTFELETAIFYAVVRSVVPAICAREEKVDYTGKVLSASVKKRYWHVGVYGDDIIVPSAYAHEVADRLRFCGFTVNEEKSFISRSPGFRESCGGDYLYGYPVRPLYFTKALSDGSQIITTANRVLEKAHEVFGDHSGDDRFSDRRYRGLHDALVRTLPGFMMKLTTPPYVSGGLWMNETGPKDYVRGQAMYRVFSTKSEVVPLQNIGLFPSGKNLWPTWGNGCNLAAARLSLLGYQPYDDEVMRIKVQPGSGNESVLRSENVIRMIPALSSISQHTRWLGWRFAT